ncbi:MAG: response regulator, partial [Proteobacteria bacterium]|nr:response regulator [Pseudomonadota bacterium]
MKKILIIDDSKDIADAFQIILEDEGYDVSVVNNGEDGLKIATTELFDLIFLDIKLPGISGIE